MNRSSDKEVAFTRAGVEHLFRLAKSEIGLGQFEDRSYQGLLRYMILCQLALLFVAEQTDRLREKKRGTLRVDDGTDRPSAQYPLSSLAERPLRTIPT